MKIKDIIKSEVDNDLKNLVDLAIEKHSKILSINQIQRVPDNKMEGFKNELKGLKEMMSDFVQRERDMTDRFYKFDKMVPEFNLKINNLCMDMNFKANSEDINKLFNIIPNLVTKDDYEVLQSLLKEKTNYVEFVEMKKNMSHINTHLKKLVP